MAGSALDANVDPAELAKFQASPEYWWNRRGALKALHDINPLRLDYIRQRMALPGKRVIDVGCGGGILSEAMAGLGARVTGIDMGPAPLAAARSHARRSDLAVTYIQSSAEAFAAAHPAAFDGVACMELLEHVPRPDSVVRACRELVRPGGHVFFATLNRTPKAYLLAILAAEYVLGLIPKKTHDYRRFVKPSELTGWARRAGMSLVDLMGLHYNPILRRYWLGGNLHINYLACFRRPPGGASGGGLSRRPGA